jgi:putative addiction module killer protein
MYIIQTTEEFTHWFADLRDRMVKMRIQARIDRAEMGNFGDCAPVGGGVFEMRLHFGAGWRVYYAMHGGLVVVLLAGGNKSSQSSDIQIALALADALQNTNYKE